MTKISPEGLLEGARYVASPNCDERPAGTAVTLLVLHSISLPPGKYGGDAIERLFTNRLDPHAHPYFAQISSLKVSSHFLLRRDGAVLQFVPLARRAWHAGASSWRGLARCNDFSVGIELEGTDDAAFEPAQYRRLCELIGALRAALPLRDIAAHSDVAPDRKTDPGARFDWVQLLSALSARQK
ncbi:MAG: 1,6-anhydro-N-acetylmuramyl-L-alanine amidase AmpD [Pseudomonadota bacterium]|nr:1,6-anhydro-N-acetylmuramyl-L-alanine amidase AmpD [Pseudomonadota bacterium]